ncbi:MAG: DUF4335 domain-containing protein [Nostocaceae cyanobacterium]|nr:DUF4335 domain-containing protein [Nostocaceae cyanobacterium]
MNIQRKYSLPNCTLILEGLSDATRAAKFQEMRPQLSILVNAECHVSGLKQPLAGGREFFESLVRTVSAYAQELLSNIPHPQAHNLESELVQLQKIDTNQHRLIVHREIPTQDAQSDTNNHKPPIEVDLNTVQFFDLVEAVDQFFADSQTLPELSLELQPVSKGYGDATKALLQQAVPAGVGATSLAAAAIAFALVPTPPVRTPEAASEQQPQPTNTTTNTTSSTSNSTELSPETIAETPTPTPIANVTPTPNTPSSTVQDLETLLTQAPEITDVSWLWALRRRLYNQIHPSWKNRSGLPQDLVFRVGVAENGDVLGYKAVNKQANQQVNKTPLPQLVYNAANRSSEPIAQFRVVFKRNQILEVSPWLGFNGTPKVLGTEITDAKEVQQLKQQLESVITQTWNRTTYPGLLKYRVAVSKDGKIRDLEAINPLAFDYSGRIPLGTMVEDLPINTKEPLAHFQLEALPNGSVVVKPWQGY